ncbi:MAG: epoxyqueuosine reductase [Deltaproteobacteria bacterium]|nr:epoxyqueuosine reductase [Deltaproteobacteria bacterium]
MKNRIEQLAQSLGADLFGMASVERFEGAPKGFHPTDIYAKTRSVIVVAVSVPSEALFAQSRIPYSHVNSLCSKIVDTLTYNLSRALEKEGIYTIPLPSDDPSEYWDAEQQRAQGVLSMRHAGMLAGLGKLGKNSLLINDRFGSMIQMGALLTAEIIDPSPLADYDVCKPNCNACINACPENAIENGAIIQKRCRSASHLSNPRGFDIRGCFECRKKCPHVRGIRAR